MRTRNAALRATYRVQLNHEFTFAQAQAIVPYLAGLGISHLYVSPILHARAGSMHGYDVVDFSRLNPELGTEAEFEALAAELHRYSMGLIVDVVPNHSGIFTNENRWWLDVLEHGPAAEHARYFDIDFHPPRSSLQNRVLVPILEASLGATLDAGKLRVEFDEAAGTFRVAYHDHRFPLDPREYPRLFPAGAPDVYDGALRYVLARCATMPTRDRGDPLSRAERRRVAGEVKQTLVELARNPAVREAIDDALLAINAPSERELLGECLDAQAYRLAHWRVARDEINYRRFFDVAELAALRMQEPAVFADTHRVLFHHLGTGAIDGFRIDHPDGLYDPQTYFERLQQVAGEAAPLYVVIEKILANHEKLPREWPVSGTTGYDFAALAVAWLHDAAGEPALDRIYHAFLQRMPLRPAHPIAPVEKESGDPADFFDIASQARRLVMNSVLAAEVSVLAWQADRIAQADRHTADFTRDTLRAALVEVLAHFPVYRTYRSERGLSAEDERYIEWAIRVARRRSQLADPSVFDFLHELLTGTEDIELAPDVRARRIEFALKFQQVSAPVMAKGIEDTALYIYNRQIALNDVGSDPRVFSISTAALHKANETRASDWPTSMLATSTHDSKRSEDVRSRLAVLSELPAPWGKAVSRWRHLHRGRRRVVDDMPAPSRNDEYYLYQTILGAWPLAGSAAVDATFVDRIVEHMLKIVREAKVRTSWTNPNSEYEAAVEEFTRRLFERPRRNAFMREMNRLHDTYGYFGVLNGLSLMTLKVCAPGVADFYQGTELPALALVDPDNRRPVNYPARVDVLARESNPAELLEQWRDGEVKLHLIRELLEWRRLDPELFTRGSYVPLQVEGEASEHVCAFARVLEERALVAVVPRCLAKLSRGVVQPPALLPWADTRVALPAGLELEGAEGPAQAHIYMSRAMARFPLTIWWARNREPPSRVRESRAATDVAEETEARSNEWA